MVKIYCWILKYGWRVCGVTHAADTCGEFRVVRHPENTSSNTLDYKSPHVSAVCVTAHTLNNFNFEYCIIIHIYFIIKK
jgi:hypothetical protein